MPAESFLDLPFPTLGVDLSQAFGLQRGGTSPLAINVRGFEPTTLRARGGQRPGLSRYLAAQVSGTHSVQDLSVVAGIGYSAPAGGIADLVSGRVVTLVAVSNGNIKVVDSGTTAFFTPTSGTGALSSTAPIFSSVNNQKLWFADGTNYKYYDPSDNTVHAWTASAGSLPTGDGGGTPRLIETWRGRTVLSGLLKGSQNWFMSRVNDPTDFDYGPLSPGPTDPVAGNNAPQGLIGDSVMTMIPYTDDVLVFGCAGSIWMLSGDPMAGGNLDLVSREIGMAWGRPWCMDPYGNIYFFSNRTGIYTMVPGQQPQRISGPIEQLLLPISPATNAIRFLWDDRAQGLHIYATPTTSSAAGVGANHFFYEQRSGAWWVDNFQQTLHNPLCSCVMDGTRQADRVCLVGSWDGYVRAIDPTALTDDSFPIFSSVLIGPLLTKDLDDVLVKDLQAILGETSVSVSYAVFAGTTAESALSSGVVARGTWYPGRNFLAPIRKSAHALWVQISAQGSWSMETIRARISGKGKVRARGK